MSQRLVGIFALLVSAIPLFAADDANLPAPNFKASLICFNGKEDSGSNCRTTMAKIEGGLRVTTSKLTCGFKGAVSEITWTYRGQKDGHDLYHLARKFPADSEDATTTKADVEFDGKRHVLFEDKSQCVVIDLDLSK